MSHFAETVAYSNDAGDRVSRLVRRRYREEQEAIGAQWNETLETLLSHRTVRSYLPTALPAGTLELAISAAQSAPSSSNLQAWSVVAVEDPALKSRLNAVAHNQRHIEQAPLLLVWLADLSRLRSIANDRGHPSDGLDYLESFLLGVIDATLAAQNALVTFESFGLGTCYIGAIRNNPEKVSEELGLPAEVFPVFGMTVGFPDPAVETGVKPRLARHAVLHRERYGAPEKQALESYDNLLRGFQAEQSMPLIDWTEQASRRIGTVEALKNRDRIREALVSLGFKLK